MDPISSLIAVWLVVLFLTTRAPKLLMESRDGGVDDEYAARLKRLADAGVEPASEGGPLRRFLGNAWRDFLVDRHDRRKAAADAAGSGRSWWSRQADKALDAWRERHKSPDAERDDADHDKAADSGSGPTTDDRPEPVDNQSNPDEQWETETVEDTAHWGAFDSPDSAAPDAANEEPIRVESTTGDPIPNEAETRRPRDPQPALPQGEPEMTAVLPTGGEVTGVVSGAHEARAIQRQVEAITAAYVAALRRVGLRISHLGEAAMSNVQLQQNSAVVAAIVQAAESNAAAMGYARGNATEVEGALQVVAVAFNRLNS